MGIVCTLVSISDENIHRLHNDPALIWRFLNPDDPELYLSEIGAGYRPGFIARFFGKKEIPVPESVPDLSVKPDEREEVDLDKSWNGIGFCLKNLAARGVPDIFESGREVGRVEIGYGPALTLDSSRVNKIANAIEPVSEAEILSVFKPDLMGKVYPSGMWSSEEDWHSEYLIENFTSLREFFLRLRESSFGVCVCFS